MLNHTEGADEATTLTSAATAASERDIVGRSNVEGVHGVKHHFHQSADEIIDSPQATDFAHTVHAQARFGCTRATYWLIILLSSAGPHLCHCA